ncbi:coproporphyrinogen dehydrogenase HemZ [Lutispora thermophila]|uniref:Oxygen-independent coproporphyrinogen-3 oxidase n=1 Tax=Lutispora thermophila DSM 19022 TaxID=1122184 RepID=A0A1M6HNW7_9FIRM|nr:coproporphyrinogen dehydrogenase HemZ [Lutispora thermophila]SHJ23823.1 oxygen-independent coproporphyrinogen-3 oxidase [Lutispora thermophila DSM 19022]
MIILKLIGHEYFNEVSDIIKLFYGKESIKLYDNTESYVTMQGKMLTSELIIGDYITSFISSYKDLNSNNVKRYNFTKSGNVLDSKEIKKSLKVSMFKLLSDITGYNIPWGILTGIRPVKIVHKLFEEGMSKDQIIEHLKEEYYVTEDRAILSIKVAQVEKKYISQKNNKKVGIYVGIPFCPSRCNYCSFTSNTIEKNRNLVQPYLEALMLEIKTVSQYLRSKGVTALSVYIGGGTPTSINADEISTLVQCINEFWGQNEEFTCEAGRPDTITIDKLKALKENGITRLSINPQTMDDKTLVRIGRKHTSAQVAESFYLAREIGFDNINMDMIIGLPGEGLEQVENTLDWMNKLNPENVTVHTLAIKRASVYNEVNLDAGSNNDIAYKMMELARKKLEINQYYPYYLYRQKYMAQNLENIGFCKKDKECVYNMQIMEEKQSIVAFGADAVTKAYFPDKDRLERQHNIKDLSLYIKNIDNQINKKIDLLSNLY